MFLPRTNYKTLILALMSSSLLISHVPSQAMANEGLAQSSEVIASDGQGIVNEIKVRGSERIEPRTILSYLELKEGDRVSKYDIDKSLKSLFKTGFFADVGMEYDGSTLLIDVVENPTISQIIFEGNDSFEDDDLQNELQLKPRSIYTRPKVQSDLQRILSMYRRAGRFHANISPKLISREQNRVDIVYEIEEGVVSRVANIAFVGNKNFTTPTLKQAIRTKEICWYCFLTDNDKYDPEKLLFDKELLRKFYTTQGYADFKVVSALAELRSDKNDFYITFNLDEGTKYDVGDVVVNSSLKEADKLAIEKVVSTDVGEFYDSETVENSIDSIVAEMGNKGFAFVDVKPKLARDKPNKTIDVIYNVDEGPRVYVEKINITGNLRTLEEVIRREFKLAEGDPFSTTKLSRSEERLNNLGFFEDVSITRDIGSAPDKVIINVAVVEKSTGELSLGAGFSTTDGVLTEFGISEKNLLGRGQNLRFKGLFAAERQQFDIGFTEPYFLNRELSTGFDLFKTTQDLSSESSFNRESVGGRLRAGYTISEHLRHSLHYSYEEVNITDVDATASLFVQQQEGTNVTSLIGHSLIYDRRNNKFDPTEGHFMQFNQDLAGLGGDSKFLRHELRNSYYVPIAPKWTLLLASSVGHVLGLQSEDIRINDRFFVGGRTLRGFDNAGIGPRDLATEDALGGNIFYTTTAELKFPLGLPDELGFSGAIFVDAGSLFDVDATGAGLVDDKSIRASAGIGIAWRSPFGPIRVDFSNAFKKEDYDITESFRFNFGTRF